MAANSLFVIDSKFEPFSFDELLKPYAAYAEAYEKTEAAYNEIASKADKFAYLADTLPADSKARRIYEGYANDLKQQAAILADRGLGHGSRRALSGLKRRYEGEIGRIEQADKRKTDLTNLQLEASMKDPTLMYTMDAATTDLDYFLDNPNATFKTVSGENDLYKKAMQGAAAISSRNSGVRVGKEALAQQERTKELANLANQYIAVAQYAGYNSKQAQDILANMQNYPEFQQLKETILSSSGVRNLSPQDQERANSYINQGIISGLTYKEALDLKANGEYISAAQRRQFALEDRRLSLEQTRINNENNRYWRGVNREMGALGMIPDSSSPTGYRFMTDDELKSIGYTDAQISNIRANIGGGGNNKTSGKTKTDENTLPADSTIAAYNAKIPQFPITLGKDSVVTFKAPGTTGKKYDYSHNAPETKQFIASVAERVPAKASPNIIDVARGLYSYRSNGTETRLVTPIYNRLGMLGSGKCIRINSSGKIFQQDVASQQKYIKSENLIYNPDAATIKKIDADIAKGNFAGVSEHYNIYKTSADGYILVPRYNSPRSGSTNTAAVTPIVEDTTNTARSSWIDIDG